MLTVIPVTDVLHACAKRQSQAPARFPGIGHKKGGCLVGSIGNRRRVVFTVARQYAHREVGDPITRTKLVVGKEIWVRTRGNREVAILIRAESALVVISVLRVCAHLHRVSAPDLGQCVAELGSFLTDRIFAWRIVKDGSL